MANFMKQLSREHRDFLQMDLIDDYEEAERKRIRATISREDSRNLREQSLSVRQQYKTVSKLMDDMDIDEVTKKSKLEEFRKEKLKELGIEL